MIVAIEEAPIVREIQLHWYSTGSQSDVELDMREPWVLAGPLSSGSQPTVVIDMWEDFSA